MLNKLFFFLLFASLNFAQGYYYAGGVPSITFITATAAGNTSASGRTNNGAFDVTLPSGTTAGQVAIIILYNDQGSGTTPTNWNTTIAAGIWPGQDSPFALPNVQIFWKTLWTTEATPSITISNSASLMSHCAAVLVYSNVDTTTAITVTGASSTGTGSPMTAGAITTTSANQVVIGICGRGDNESSSTQTFGGSATGVNERLDAGTSEGGDSQVSAYDLTIATTSTSSGDGSAATSASDAWVSGIIGLKLK